MILSLLAASVAQAAPAAAAAPGGPDPHRPPPGYTLVFADEFDGSGLPDPARWDFAVEGNAAGWGNQEKQHYTARRPENARVEGGRLVIEARAETLPEAAGKAYSSARLVTRGRAAWTYGFYEVKARLPCGRGTWPAIWMLPEDPAVRWPRSGEIDIMEHVGFEPGKVHHSVHTGAFNFASGTQKTAGFAVPTACTAFHRYQLMWTPDFLVMGVDDEARFMFRKVVGGRDRWPFDKPMHLLLNIAVGGTWGGQKGIDAAAFPARMEVDHVRVYQRAPAAAAAAATTPSKR
jgi:beta-glucanase (GH16 family)